MLVMVRTLSQKYKSKKLNLSDILSESIALWVLVSGLIHVSLYFGEISGVLITIIIWSGGFVIASAFFIYHHAKLYGRNHVAWTTAFLFFSPVWAGLVYALTWPKNAKRYGILSEPPKIKTGSAGKIQLVQAREGKVIIEGVKKTIDKEPTPLESMSKHTSEMDVTFTYCSKCGRKLSEDMDFCPRCGKHIS